MNKLHSAVPQPGRLLQQPHSIASTEVTSLFDATAEGLRGLFAFISF